MGILEGEIGDVRREERRELASARIWTVPSNLSIMISSRSRRWCSEVFGLGLYSGSLPLEVEGPGESCWACWKASKRSALRLAAARVITGEKLPS